MPQITTKVEGLRELKARMQELGPKIARQAMTEGLESGGNVLMEAIAKATPVHEGELKAHIMKQVEVAPSGTSGAVYVGFGKQGYIAMWVELGHRIVGHKPDKADTGERVPPHPFIRPAFDATRTEARNRAVEVVRSKVQGS